jgi:uncharacterized damage-inducible protein DinB
MLARQQRIYPIGKLDTTKEVSAELRAHWVVEIEQLPATLTALASQLSEEDLEKRYRLGGWTVRQIIHHVADSHTNAYVRLKLALTENHPNIAPYDENLWAEMEDSKEPIAVSLRIIAAIHERMCIILKNMKPSDFERTYFHPGYKKTFTLDEMLALYAWHGKHHQEQVRVAISLNQDELD